ncbi:MAG: hypothetical protein LQ350_002980 [Teloschistes chrysophthalmus]|nr:MAG: hypothetical protein LQ350_002980 [Niorma chrysophthalma]
MSARLLSLRIRRARVAVNVVAGKQPLLCRQCLWYGGLQLKLGRDISQDVAHKPWSRALEQSRRFHDSRPSIPPDRSTSAIVPTDYRKPTTGLLSYLPDSWVPYAELTRLDKPAGTYYLFFPCLFSTLMAASYTHAPPLAVLETSMLFLTGAFIMRGAGCTINDLWDKNLDPYVARTRLRPIARRAITPFKALTFTGFQLLSGLLLLLQFPTSCLFYGIPSLLLVATYPLAKRVTHYPQFVLGLAFSWGAFMGFPALGVDLLSDPTAAKAVMALYSSCISWTVLYDMIYAHMDIKDDAKVGIKSIALRHAADTKAVLSGLAVVQTGLLVAAGWMIGASPVFFISTTASTVATLGLMIWKVKLKEVSNCWWWFKYGAWFTGGGVSLGLLTEYGTQVSHKEAVTQTPPSALEELVLGYRTGMWPAAFTTWSASSKKT